MRLSTSLSFALLATGLILASQPAVAKTFYFTQTPDGASVDISRHSNVFKVVRSIPLVDAEEIKAEYEFQKKTIKKTGKIFKKTTTIVTALGKSYLEYLDILSHDMIERRIFTSDEYIYKVTHDGQRYECDFSEAIKCILVDRGEIKLALKELKGPELTPSKEIKKFEKRKCSLKNFYRKEICKSPVEVFSVSDNLNDVQTEFLLQVVAMIKLRRVRDGVLPINWKNYNFEKKKITEVN